MDCINRTAVVNLETPHCIVPQFRFVFVHNDGSDYNLSGSSAVFNIYDDRLVLILSISSASDGLVVAGNIIDLTIAIPEYSRVREYPRKQYKYNLTVNDDFRIQGSYRSLIRAGEVGTPMPAARVVMSSSVVQVALAPTAGIPGAQGPAGESGPQGPPGTAQAAEVNLPAAAALAGQFRKVLSVTAETIEVCKQIGVDEWAWCPIIKTEWQ